MANPHRGEVAVTIDGKERILRFPMKALAELQEHLGIKDIKEFINVDMSNFGTLLIFLFHGLSSRWPELTFEQLQDMMISPTDIILPVATAFNLALAGGDADPLAGETTSNDGTGRKPRKRQPKPA